MCEGESYISCAVNVAFITSVFEQPKTRMWIKVIKYKKKKKKMIWLEHAAENTVVCSFKVLWMPFFSEGVLSS